MHSDNLAMPLVVDRGTFQGQLDALRVREKAHTREGDAIAAARRRLPMVEVDANLALIGGHGPLTLLDAFEGHRQLIAYYFMWNPGLGVALDLGQRTSYVLQDAPHHDFVDRVEKEEDGRFRWNLIIDNIGTNGFYVFTFGATNVLICRFMQLGGELNSDYSPEWQFCSQQ